MKKLFVVLLMVPLFFSCNQESGDANLTKITGIADNLEAGLFVLGSPGGVKDTVQIDGAHSFDFTIVEIEKPGNYYLLSEKDYFPMYIAPGMQLDIYFDKADFMGSLNFGGPGADINNYKVDKTRDFGPVESEVYTKEPAAFRAWNDSILTAQQSLLNEAAKDNANDPFWAQEEGELLYSWAMLFGNYPSYYKYYSEGNEVDLPEDFDSYKEKLNINDVKYLASPAFKNFVNAAIREVVSEKVKAQEGLNRSLVTLETGMELLTNIEVLDDFMLSTITGRMQWTDLSEMTEEIEFFKANCDNEASLAEFNEQYEAWGKLAKGAPAFVFEGHDLDGKLVKFSDFKGKYVYVDIWATWCGPCKYEIPFLKQLEADYHDKNIVFLSYSIDEDKDAWLKFVPENELGGVQIIGENAWESQLCKDYKIRGVPTFMFFDPAGNILNVKMSRPSAQATRDAFDSYADL